MTAALVIALSFLLISLSGALVGLMALYSQLDIYP